MNLNANFSEFDTLKSLEPVAFGVWVFIYAAWDETGLYIIANISIGTAQPQPLSHLVSECLSSCLKQNMPLINCEYFYEIQTCIKNFYFWFDLLNQTRKLEIQVVGTSDLFCFWTSLINSLIYDSFIETS